MHGQRGDGRSVYEFLRSEGMRSEFDVIKPFTSTDEMARSSSA